MAEKEAKKKTKRPTALKRDIRNEKRRLINKAFKTEVRSSIRKLEDALKASDREAATVALKDVYSKMDKGVKKKQFKPNKANRVKSRLTAKVSALSS